MLWTDGAALSRSGFERTGCIFRSRGWTRPAHLAVSETKNLLTLPLPLVGVSIGTKEGLPVELTVSPTARPAPAIDAVNCHNFHLQQRQRCRERGPEPPRMRQTWVNMNTKYHQQKIAAVSRSNHRHTSVSRNAACPCCARVCVHVTGGPDSWMARLLAG